MKDNKYLVIVNFEESELCQVVYLIEATNSIKATRKAKDLLIEQMSLVALGADVEIEIFFPVDNEGNEIKEGELLLVETIPEYSQEMNEGEKLVKDEPLFFEEILSYEANMGTFKKLNGEKIYASCDIFRKINQEN